MSRCFGCNEWKAWSYEDNDRPDGNSKTENPKDGFPRWKILLSILHTRQCDFLFKVHNFPMGISYAARTFVKARNERLALPQLALMNQSHL